MDDFKIREYQERDFDALWRIDQECFPSGIAYSKQELKSYIHRSGAFTLLAEDAGKVKERIAAFIVVEADRTGIGHILTLDVRPAAQRNGLGTLLLQMAELRLASRGCNAVLLEAAVDNAAALAFYKRHRYTVLETIPRYYLDSVDALVMGKRLVSSS
jgi:ribosomal-protein-alanine N-acetyltransferase